MNHPLPPPLQAPYERQRSARCTFHHQPHPVWDAGSMQFDPLYVANEGKLLAFVPPADAEKVLAAMNGHPLGKYSVIIGEVVRRSSGTVVLRARIGGSRVVDMLRRTTPLASVKQNKIKNSMTAPH